MEARRQEARKAGKDQERLLGNPDNLYINCINYQNNYQNYLAYILSWS